MWTFLLSPKEKGAAMVPGSGRLAAINYAMIGSSGIDVGIVPTTCSGPDIVPFDGAVGDVSTWGRSTAIEYLQESPPTSVGYLARQGLLPVYQLLGDAISGNLGGCWSAPESKKIASTHATDANLMSFSKFETQCMCNFEPVTHSDYIFYFLTRSLTAQDRYDAIKRRGIWKLGPVVGWIGKARVARAAFETIQQRWFIN